MELLVEPDMLAPSRGDGSIESVAVMPASADSCLLECAAPEANRDTIRDIIRDIDVPNRHLLNNRQLWFLTRVAAGDRCCAVDIAVHWQVSEKTARRDIALMKEWELIRFVGTLRRGHYIALSVR